MLTDVRVTRQVVEYARLRAGKKIREAPRELELPQRTLTTVAVAWTIPNECVVPLPGNDLGGAAHAAEHASIGLLPLFATCDRWDVGGLSTELHPATGQLTVFVYDGHAGGAGFAERGFAVAADWLRATRDRDQRLPLRGGLPVLRPVAQVRQRQLAAVQGRGRHPSRPRPGQRALSGRRVRAALPSGETARPANTFRLTE